MLCFPGLPLQAGANKLSSDLPSEGETDVIVQYKSAPNSLDLANSQAKGGKLNKVLPSMRGASCHVHAALLSALASDSNVAYVSPDRPVLARGIWMYGPH